MIKHLWTPDHRIHIWFFHQTAGCDGQLFRNFWPYRYVLCISINSNYWLLLTTMPSVIKRTTPPKIWIPKNEAGSSRRLPFIQQLKRSPWPGEIERVIQKPQRNKTSEQPTLILFCTSNFLLLCLCALGCVGLHGQLIFVQETGWAIRATWNQFLEVH